MKRTQRYDGDAGWYTFVAFLVVVYLFSLAILWPR